MIRLPCLCVHRNMNVITPPYPISRVVVCTCDRGIAGVYMWPSFCVRIWPRLCVHVTVGSLVCTCDRRFACAGDRKARKRSLCVHVTWICVRGWPLDLVGLGIAGAGKVRAASPQPAGSVRAGANPKAPPPPPFLHCYECNFKGEIIIKNASTFVASASCASHGSWHLSVDLPRRINREPNRCRQPNISSGLARQARLTAVEPGSPLCWRMWVQPRLRLSVITLLFQGLRPCWSQWILSSSWTNWCPSRCKPSSKMARPSISWLMCCLGCTTLSPLPVRSWVNHGARTVSGGGMRFLQELHPWLKTFAWLWLCIAFT